MLLSSVFGIALSAVVLSTLVAGDLGAVVKLYSVKVENIENEYFGNWSAEITPTDKTSQLTVNMPTKKEVPDTIQVKIYLSRGSDEPFEIISDVCSCLDDESVGKSFISAGIPKGEFPMECPFIAGDWIVDTWDPPVEKIPPGIEDGPVFGTLLIMEEGKEPYVKVEVEGELMHESAI